MCNKRASNYLSLKKQHFYSLSLVLPYPITVPIKLTKRLFISDLGGKAILRMDVPNGIRFNRNTRPMSLSRVSRLYCG